MSKSILLDSEQICWKVKTFCKVSTLRLLEGPEEGGFSDKGKGANLAPGGIWTHNLII